jgi:AcrR family transcriptional regulator
MPFSADTPLAPPRRPGRPRSQDADVAILDAALALLTDEGYARMTMDAVAAAAGVSKATIYLRYRSKADLATAALAHLRDTAGPEPTGDLRTDLVALLRQMRRNTARFRVMPLIGTCLAEEQHTPELLPLFRERSVRPRRARLAAMLETAGGAPEQVGPAVDMLIGAFHMRSLAGDPFPADWEERVVDIALAGLGLA